MTVPQHMGIVITMPICCGTVTIMTISKMKVKVVEKTTLLDLEDKHTEQI